MFDAPLFREPPDPDSKLTPKSSIVLHPTLDEMDLNHDDVRDIILYGDKKEWRVQDLNIASEFVTCPSSSTVYFRGFASEGSGVTMEEDDEGVTIGHLIAAIAEDWAQPAHRSEIERARRDTYARGEIERLQTAGKEVTALNMLYMFSDHVFFEGFTAPSVDADGDVLLEAHGFGS